MAEQVGLIERPSAVSADVAVVESVYDAFARGDVPALFALFAPDCTVYQSSRLPWGGRYEGHAGVAAFLGKLTETVHSRVASERFIDDEEGHVIAIGTTSGRVVATGQSFTVLETHVWTVANGSVMRFESYIDTRLMRQALGI